MPAKSVEQWEADIARAMSRIPTKRLSAIGLYTLMRSEFEDVILAAEQPDQQAALLPTERPAVMAERESASSAACLARLSDAGLISIDPKGIDMPHVRAIHKLRLSTRKRVRALRNAHEGVTEGVTSPPKVSPPITPSSYPPPNTHSGDEINSRIRNWVAGHRFLSAASMGTQQWQNIREAVIGYGWNSAIAMMEKMIDRHCKGRCGEPTSYALQSLRNQGTDVQAAAGAKPKSPPPLTEIKVYD